ncbi:hypothetical protein GCM10023194_61220 [Planotetraspora phitsanulokensis]|uniref:Lipoprotein n=1 Tax=Planotetraspora phitsanulokensis TaxID=575192 RepID=A0A8J3XDT1_9ACTN|nr:hypothetical protein [Planotetraspora phitsanulokensis]GII37657.1 hypothetical protein Pph01_26600 [Planotetraspora phitsanulokensis]
MRPLRSLRGGVCGALTVLCLALVAACGGGGSDTPQADGDLTYGYAPRSESPVEYQPDVVIVKGGGSVIRSISEDGLTYTIDGDADGAGDVRPGKVMFVTGEAAGRVVRVERSNDDLAVTLAPVELTDIVRNGSFSVDQPIDVAAQRFQPLPDLLGEVDPDTAGPDSVSVPESDSSSGGTAAPPAPLPGQAASGPRVVSAFAPAASSGTVAVAVPAVQLVARDRSAPSPGPTAQTSKVGAWEIQAAKSPSQLTLHADHAATAKKGLKVGLDVTLKFNDLRVRSSMTVANGTIVKPQLRLLGITGIAITVHAGAGGGYTDNKKARIELPVELKQPILIGGFPATLKQTFKLLVETAFSAKNATISAGGEWGLSGPLGLDGGTVLTPTFSVRKSIMDSLRGVSIGVEGIVVAAEFRFGIMVGLPVAGAGPYVGVVASLGLTNGSAAGRVGLPLAGPAVKCKGTTLVLTVRGGAGINLSAPLAKAIEKTLKVKVPAEKDIRKKDIVNRTVTQPDVPLCKS